jgi:cell division protein FtsQ
MKNTLNTLGWIGLFAGLIVVLGFVESTRLAQSCKAVTVHIDQNDENFFIENKDILSMLPFDLELTDSFPVEQIDVKRIEHHITNHPAISKAEVYLSIDGKLHISVTQRKPIARIFSGNKESYYLDKDGYLMPTSQKFTSRVMVISGHINEPYTKWYRHRFTPGSLPDSVQQKTYLDDLFQLADFIQKNSFWRAQIEHINVNKDLEVELIPRVGSHTIVLGEIVDIQEKFDKLMRFYLEGLDKTGWNEYEVINLKFENQVVCSKRYN